MGSGQSSSIPTEQRSEKRSPQTTRGQENIRSNNQTRKQKKETKTLTNKFQDQLPGEDDDTYNGFFDDVEDCLQIPVKNNLNAKYDKISLPDEELKQLIKDVDEQLEEDVKDDDHVVRQKPISRSANMYEYTSDPTSSTIKDKSAKSDSNIRASVSKARKSTTKFKNKINKFNIRVDEPLDFNFKQETIEGFDLEKFRQANVKNKGFMKNENNSNSYKVLGVDTYDISSTVKTIDGNHRMQDANQVPKYDFADERLMSQIESEFLS
ncbi:Uncharacterised protein g9412 [Pycnogonum litorale]